MSETWGEEQWRATAMAWKDSFDLQRQVIAALEAELRSHKRMIQTLLDNHLKQVEHSGWMLDTLLATRAGSNASSPAPTPFNSSQ